MLHFFDYLIILAVLIFLYLSFKLIIKVVLAKIHKKRYTREFFAFFSISSLVSLAVLLFSYFLNSNIWDRILKATCVLINKSPLKKYITLEITNSSIINPPDFSDKFLCVVVFIVICWIVFSFFRNWNLGTSQRNYEELLQRKQGNIFEDFIAYFNKSNRIPIQEGNFTVDKTQIWFESKSETDVPWRISVGNLILLSDNQVNLDIDGDWHEVINSYIFTNKKFDKKYCILCKRIVEDSDVNRVIAYLKQNDISASIASFKVIYNDVNKITLTKIDSFELQIINQSSLIDKLVNFEEYYSSIIEKFENQEIISGNDTHIQDIYTEPFCDIHLRNSTGKLFQKVRSIENYLCEWANSNTSKKQIALLAEYGQGKSVLALRFAYLIAKKEIKIERIPILIELRAKYPKQYTDRYGLLREWAHHHDIKPDALFFLLNQGKLILLFDGFDEMELVGEYSIRIEHFRKLWEYASPKSKCIITGRPNFFLNDDELITLLRTHDSQKNTFYCEEIIIKPFDIEKIKEALRNTKQNVRDDIINTIKEHKNNRSFLDLLSRPTHLFMASIVWEKKLAKYQTNINSAIVYREFLNHCYERQNLKPTSPPPLNPLEREYFMLGIAVGMVSKNKYTNLISLAELQTLIQKLYTAFPDEIGQLDQVVQNYLPLSKRYSEATAFDTIFQDIRSCGVLVRDMSTFDSYKFSHKSFLEYLLSTFYVSYIANYERVEKSKIAANQIKNSLETDVSGIYRSPEVFGFIVDLLEAELMGIKSEDDEAMALGIFKYIYPFKKLNLNRALFLRPFLKLSNGQKILLTTTVGFIIFSLAMVLFRCLNNFRITAEIFLQTVFIVTTAYLIDVFFFRPARAFKSFMSNNMAVKDTDKDALVRYRFSDSDNLLLWFFVCKKIGVSESWLKKKLGKKKYANFSNEAVFLMSHFKE